MRPLPELPTNGIVGIFSDIDDTITHAGALVPEAYASLCAAVAAGLRVVLVTGRPGGWAEVLVALFPVAAVVAENGGYAVLRGGERLYWDSAGERVEQRRRLGALVDDVRARLPFARLSDDAELRRVDVAFDVAERVHLDTAQREVLLQVFAAHGARALVSSIHAHAFYGDHDKAKMLFRLAAERWGETPDEARARYVFVGDSPNDQAGFAAFPRSVGVANVRRYTAALAPPPGWVTSGEGGHGFAELVRHLLAARG